MKDLKQIQSEYAYSRNLEEKWQRKANILEKCLQCVRAKTYKECPKKCRYLK